MRCTLRREDGEAQPPPIGNAGVRKEAWADKALAQATVLRPAA